MTASPSEQQSEAGRTQPPAVVLEKITKHFGRFAALRDLTADFSSGRLYAILGDNGAGKSTLLRVIAGLTRPTYGSVSVFGLGDVREGSAQLGYMAHAPLLYDEMTGRENLRYFAGLYGISDPAIADRAITAVGLDPELNRYVGQYSQGMRQRLSLARAIVHDPKLLLLDEPFSNVDIASAREMVRLLATMRDSGKTILLVTHQSALLEGVADESVWMAGGRVIARRPGIAERPEMLNRAEVAR